MSHGLPSGDQIFECASPASFEDETYLERPSRMRWVMVALVFFATAINYLDRQALSVVAPFLIDLYHMSNRNYSEIVFGFMLAYTVMNGAAGPMIDRFGTRTGYTLTVAWWSTAALLHACVFGPWSLGAVRFLLGMGESGNWPAGVKVVAEWFPPKERALASGLFNSGSAVGAIVAPPFVAWIVLQFGWRAAFVAVGLSGFVWIVAWRCLYYSPKRIASEDSLRTVKWQELLATRFIWAFTAAKVFLDPVWYFYTFWFPVYLKQVRHFNLVEIGRFAWIPFFVAGIGNLLGGWFSAVLLSHRIPLGLARKLSVTVFAGLMVATIPAVLVANVDLSIALVSIAMMGYTGVTANMLAIPADILPKETVASTWGFASVGSGIGGMIFALMTGWLIDRYSYVPVFCAFGLIPMVALLILWTTLGPLHPSMRSEGDCRSMDRQ